MLSSAFCQLAVKYLMPFIVSIYEGKELNIKPDGCQEGKGRGACSVCLSFCLHPLTEYSNLLFSLWLCKGEEKIEWKANLQKLIL